MTAEPAVTEQELGYGAASNGSADAFPLDSFRAAATHLRRPFTAQAVKFKVQATWPKDSPTGGLIVSYIDARLVVERLNLIVPDLWHDDYALIGGGLMWCHLTVAGITRKDVGEGTGKGLVSDALKRAAVKFGVGVSLYAVPKMILNAGDHLKPKRVKDGTTLELTPNGETHLRRLYAGWLDTKGIEAFGRPLDHGDVEGAQGDAEAEAGESAPEQVETGEVVTDEDVTSIKAAAKGLTNRQISLAFSSLGLDATQAFNTIPKSKAIELVQTLGGVERTAEAKS